MQQSILKFILAFLLISSHLPVYSSSFFNDSKSPGYKLDLKLKKIFNESCLDSIKYSKSNSINFIKTLEKETGCNFNISLSEEDEKTLECVTILKHKDKMWSIWISINDKGLAHITETWETKDLSFLKTKFFFILKDMYKSLGNPTEISDDDLWFLWDRNKKNCGMIMITMVKDKANSFVSRRLDLQNK